MEGTNYDICLSMGSEMKQKSNKFTGIRTDLPNRETGPSGIK